MKPFLRSSAFATLLVLTLAPCYAQDAEALAKEKAKLPDAVREIAEKGDSAVTSVKKASSASQTSTEKAQDPAKWGKQEVHKLAIMDLKYNGQTETVIFELLPGAPKTVANFVRNVEAGAYKGLAFHRAIDNYLVQTGDPLTADDSKRNEWGTGGEDKTVPGEFSLPHKIGSVAMARRGDAVNPDRHSNGYQFYFALGNLSNLNGSYSVFGQVVSGLEALKEISRTPSDSNDCPLARIEVKSVRVVDQKGPLVVMQETSGSGRKRVTKPLAAKSGFSRFLERVW